MHFIIDTTNLPPQTATEQFGPVSNTIYNVASKFSLTTATKAFAPVKGQIIVQQSTDAALVNVILKPMEANKSIPVKYFVFRGITKSSFIQGTDDIIPTGSELIQRFWTDYNNWLSKLTTAPPPPKVDVFGYDQNTIANTESIRSIFMNGHDVRPFVVQEGMWIGDFAAGATAGFEIILAESSYIPTLAYARATEYKVEITTQTGFEEKKKREEILNFIDPAAFYGLFYKKGVKINGTNTKVKKEQLYTDVLEKFYTKNTIYLDIRNEEGYSYNFFENYPNGGGDNIEVNINGNGFVPQVYENNHWPILAINPTGTTNNTETDIEIKLRTDDNPEPLIYHTDVVTTPAKKYGQFIGTDAIMNVSLGITALWTNPLLFKAFNRQNGGVFQNVATYNRVNFYRQTAYAGDNKKIPKKTGMYFNLFGSIHHDELNKNYDSLNKIDINSLKHFKGNHEEEEFTHLAENKVTSDSNVVCFYAIAKEVFKKTKLNFSKILGGSKAKLLIDNKDIFPNLYFNEALIEEDDNGTVKTIPTIEISSNGLNNKEKITFLGLSKNELFQIKSAKIGTNNFNIFINLHQKLSNGDKTFYDINGKPYYKYGLSIHEHDNNGEAVKTDINGIDLYSKDNLTVYSKDFIDNLELKLLEMNPENDDNDKTLLSLPEVLDREFVFWEKWESPQGVPYPKGTIVIAKEWKYNETTGKFKVKETNTILTLRKYRVIPVLTKVSDINIYSNGVYDQAKATKSRYIKWQQGINTEKQYEESCKSLSYFTIREIMYNALDSYIKEAVDKYHIEIGVGKNWNKPDYNLVKAQILEESKMGMYGKYIFSEKTTNELIRLRFNVYQASDTYGPQQLLMMKEMSPNIYNKIYYDYDRNGKKRTYKGEDGKYYYVKKSPKQINDEFQDMLDRYANLKQKKDQGTITAIENLELYELEVFRYERGNWNWYFTWDEDSEKSKTLTSEINNAKGYLNYNRKYAFVGNIFRKQALKDFFKETTPNRNLSYKFWIETGVRWLYEKRIGGNNWHDAIGKYKGGGATVRPYVESIKSTVDKATNAEKVGKRYNPFTKENDNFFTN